MRGAGPPQWESSQLPRRTFLKLGAAAAGMGAFILNQLKAGDLTSIRPPAPAKKPPPVPTKLAAAKPKPTTKPPPAQAPPESEYAVAPYISKAIHLDALPWGKQSFYKQPWRGYLETVSGQQFLSGVGIHYNMDTNANHEVALKLLADAGFKSARVEVGWYTVNWDETVLTYASNFQRVFAACKKYGIRPVILLNAHQGMPTPAKATTRRVLSGGTLGSLELQLDTVADLVPGYSGLSNLTDYWMAEAIFTSIDPATNRVQLSKPLPKAIASGSQIPVGTLKYLPLYPIGTPQFDQTAKGWIRYVQLLMDLVRASGLDGVDVEIWNELSFGSRFLNINNYYQSPVAQFTHANWMTPGGQLWELARRTVNFINPNYPGTKVLWGFSSTSWFQADVRELPAGMDGQTYHPYGTGKRLIPRDYPPRERYSMFIEQFIPRNLTWAMPEGWAHLGSQEEYMLRLLNPETRLNKPAGTAAFGHYMTEHGSDPSEVGISDRNQALAYKAKSAIRALLFWLNKGILKMDLYSAYDASDLGFGLLFGRPDPKDYAHFAEQQLVSPALQAVKNVVAQFAGAQSLGRVRQLDVDVTSIGTQYKVFDGDGAHAPLYYREMLTFLPFQVNSSKFICAVYVMSYDITNPPPTMDFKLTVKNVNGTNARLSFYDPITNQPMPVTVVARARDRVTVRVRAVEYPRLLIIQE